MTDPALQQAADLLAQRLNDFNEATAKWKAGVLSRHVVDAAGQDYVNAERDYNAVLNTLGDGTT